MLARSTVLATFFGAFLAAACNSTPAPTPAAVDDDSLDAIVLSNDPLERGQQLAELAHAAAERNENPRAQELGVLAIEWLLWETRAYEYEANDLNLLKRFASHEGRDDLVAAVNVRIQQLGVLRSDREFRSFRAQRLREWSQPRDPASMGVGASAAVSASSPIASDTPLLLPPPKRENVTPPNVGEQQTSTAQRLGDSNGSVPTKSAPPPVTTTVQDAAEIARQIPLKEKALEQLRIDAPNDPRIVLEELALAALHRAAGNLAEAKRLFELAFQDYLRICNANPSAFHDPKLYALGLSLAEEALQQGDVALADKLFADAEKHGKPEDADRIRAGREKAFAGMGDLTQLQRDIAREVQGSAVDPGSTIVARARLSAVIDRRIAQTMSDSATSAAGIAPSVLASLDLLPPTDPSRIDSEKRLALRMQLECQLDDALALRRSLLSRLQSAALDLPDELEEARRNVAAILRVIGRYEDARQLEDG